MCGIAGLIAKQPGELELSKTIAAMSAAIRHRGPDGEGFILATPTDVLPFYSADFGPPGDAPLNYLPHRALKAKEGTFLAFAHRRLAIIDLSEHGHQPMATPDGRYWITYNGELYNYIELRAELSALGYRFISGSDTEVILAAYRHWGEDAVQRFNGMWAFCIYDSEKKVCFASRDRFGVKPFYYVDQRGFFAFASEQKAFVRSGLLRAKADRSAVHNYLLNNRLENRPENFFEGITELWPGHNLTYTVATGQVRSWSYFHLRDHITLENDHLSDALLIEKVAATLEQAVKLRLRSDVEVGTCLSGGIDSSALAVIIAGSSNHPLHCFTSVFRNEKFNEERWADAVARQIGAKHFKTEPSAEDFEREADDLIFSQDVPIWSTSTFAQYRVMALAAEHGIKVVLDGQGADELFGGYHHHLVAFWNNLLRSGQGVKAWKELRAARTTLSRPFLFYGKEWLKQTLQDPGAAFRGVLDKGFITENSVTRTNSYFNDVNDQLIDDIYDSRLKSFLKCEDRAGMWHSVESRTPFSDDIELIQLMFSIHGNRKIKNGVTKYLLREAVKQKLPTEVYHRYDKTGFETPMDNWVGQLKPKLTAEVREAGFDFLTPGAVEKLEKSGSFNNRLLFKLYVLARWKAVFNASI